MASPQLQQFATDVAAQTGLDPRVIIAWQTAEGHPGDEPGFFNYLNIQAPTATSVGVPYTFIGPGDTAAFGSLSRGELATVREIRKLGITGGTSQTPGQQIAAIAASPWAASHYGGPGGPNLRADFVALYGQAALGSSSTPGTTRPGAASGKSSGGDGTDIPCPCLPGIPWWLQVANVPCLACHEAKQASKGAGAVGAAVGGIGDIFSFFKRLLDPQFWLRALELLGGAILVLAGLFLLAKQVGLSPPSVPVVSQTAEAVS